MGVDSIPQKECVNPERQVYVFSCNIKKIKSYLQHPGCKDHILKIHVYNKEGKK